MVAPETYVLAVAIRSAMAILASLQLGAGVPAPQGGRQLTLRNLCRQRGLSGRGLSGNIVGQLVQVTSPT